MNKSDDQLQYNVIQELTWKPTVDHTSVGVAANDGVVTLSGHVKTYAQKLSAERAVNHVIDNIVIAA